MISANGAAGGFIHEKLGHAVAATLGIFSYCNPVSGLNLEARQLSSACGTASKDGHHA
jgi:hypothetical protein